MPAAAFWICCWAFFNCAGWLLAGCGQLNAAGYAVVLVPGLWYALPWLKKHPPVFWGSKIFRRFRRPLPAVFLGLAGLILIGGALYAPANYDALTYRLPRMLNWLAAGRWFWIPTINARLNYSGVAWEWTAMPLLALLRSDRALFLINFTGFLLLPGLLFSIFRQLGVGRRTAWIWMWVLPLAYGYAVQAGSIGNDLAGTVLCLLSVFFGLRARRSGRVADVWLAMLAAALMSGVKLSNAPLGLPCLVAVWPALGLLRKHLVASAFLTAVAIVISAAPIITLNQIYTGSWTGDPDNRYQMQVKNPVAALLGNSLLQAEQVFMPPVLPAAQKVKTAVEHKLPGSVTGILKRDFPRFYVTQLTELPTEEGAGLDLGITVLLLAGLLVTRRDFVRRGPGIARSFRPPWLAGAAWVAGLVYLCKMGSEAGPRLMLPYYPLMFVPLLRWPGQERWLRFRPARLLALLAALSVLPAVVLSPLRPLWPGRTICTKLAAAHPGHPLLQRLASVYSVYAHRNDLLAPIRARLPDDAHDIGFIAGSNDTDYSLWRPFGRRRVLYLRHDTGQFLQHPGQVEWLVVKDKIWPDVSTVPLAAWASTNDFHIVLSTNLTEIVAWGGENWTLLHREK